MPLSLKQSKTISDLAGHLYNFLPGTAHPFADQEISFPGVAQMLGLPRYWPGGGKLPAINKLLSGTLEHRPEDFCKLILEIVRQGITYRLNKGTPLTREDIEQLNSLVASVGFKIPELYDRKFLGTLPVSHAPVGQSASAPQKQLHALEKKLLEISNLPPVQRGFQFERFLDELFDVYHLAPRRSFRLTGEQIDGSFQFRAETYLVEAKWQNEAIGESDLLLLSGKVAGKAEWSRGLFVIIGRFSDTGLEAFARGKRTNIICMDGQDLFHVLKGQLDLRAVIEAKARRAAETNLAFVPVRDLFPDVI